MNVSPTTEAQPGNPEDRVSKQTAEWWLEVATSIRAGRISRALRFVRWIATVSPDDKAAQLWLLHLSRRLGHEGDAWAAIGAQPRRESLAGARTGFKIGVAIVLSVLGLALLPFLHLSFGSAEWRALDTTTGDGQAPTATATATATATPVVSREISCAELPEPGEPLAAIVGGQGISLQTFDREFTQYLAELEASGIDLQDAQTLARMPEYRQEVLDRLVYNVVVQQAATAFGIAVTEAQVEAYLETEVGQAEAQMELKRELEAKGQTWEQFLRDACQELLRQSVLQQVTTPVSGTLEMVWARQIVLDTQQDALDALTRLAAGEDFSELAQELSLDDATREQGGDLGWFPRGFARVSPEVESAAFTGSPGLVQGPILVDEQFYLVQTVDLEPDHPVDPDTSAILQEADFEQWLADQVAATDITVYVDLYLLPDGLATPEAVPETGASLPFPAWLGLTALGLTSLLGGTAMRIRSRAAER